VSAKTTGRGFKQLLAGAVPVVMASRAMNEKEQARAKEKGIECRKVYMGLIDVGIVVNANNPVDALTMEQLKDIFTGQVKNWKELGGQDQPIKVTTRRVPETGTGVIFQQNILGGAPYAPDSVVMESYRTTGLVCGKGSAIGYIPLSSTYASESNLAKFNIKLIAIRDGDQIIEPHRGVKKVSSYPCTIPFYLYWNTAASPCATDLPQFSKRFEDQRSRFSDRSAPLDPGA
jgi:phosphate transport system substrate-binding protein